MSMANIRKSRGVPAKRGGRVRYTGGKSPRLGTITSSNVGYLMIKLDGDRWARAFHPTWELEYLDAKPEEKPLFIPLKREYFDAFVAGSKTHELRKYGPRWNERTCRVGRRVTLSLGYGKQQRRSGVVVSFAKSETDCKRADWVACYGAGQQTSARIGIQLDEVLE